MTEKCYYKPTKECRWGCHARCDDGWDFVAGGSPCRRPLWLHYAGWASLVTFVILGAAKLIA